MLDVNRRAKIMDILFQDYKTDNMTYFYNGSVSRYHSKYKNVPIAEYEQNKRFIDFTRFYAIFRGPRRKQVVRSYYTGKEYTLYDSTTRKANAVKVDIYEYANSQIQHNRQQRMDYLNYCLQNGK
jgi:hypothetical protein